MPIVLAWRSSLGTAVALIVCLSATASAAACPNETLRGPAERRLPDCRAYEQVSPPAKNGNDVGLQTLTVPAYVAASDGDALAFETIGDLPGGSSATTFNQNLSRRGLNGWTTMPISPPQAPRNNADWPLFEFFTANLRETFVRTPPGPSLAPGEVAGGSNFYLRDNDSGQYTALSVGTPIGNRATTSYSFGGASADLSHIIFESDDALTPDAPISFPDGLTHSNLYEWVNGTLRLVTILPDGTPASLGGGAGVAGGAGSVIQVIDHAISGDGARVVFGTPAGAAPDGAQIYIRENGQRTVEASRSRRATPDPALSPPQFWGAAADVSKVFFISASALTDDAALGSISLYRYDVGNDTLKNVTANPLGSGLSAAQGVLGMSDDGSYVYFSDKSTYFPGKGTEGESNIYLLHGDTLRYIATGDLLSSFELQAEQRTFRVTPDGRYLVFTSTKPLTGYDNVDAVTGVPDREVFLYDAATDGLKCVSCRPDGGRPTGSAALPRPSARYRLNLQRSVTDDGRRVFFDTSDALVPEDVNGKLDAYAYEDGGVRLISTGTDGNDSSFAGASATGDDVFFVTRQRLAGTDTDDNLDVYDARVDGGFPDPRPAAPCSGDGCQSAPTAPPTRQALSSSFVVGEGNAARRIPSPATYRLAALSRAARRTAARTGVLTLSVRVSEGGILKARASTVLGGHTKTIGSATTHASRAGTVRLRLRLAKLVRAKLALGRTVRVSVRVNFSHGSHAKTLTLELHR